ncbi:MAG TPA: HAMP domain-containing sensor histidine kinase [Actinotalea caeni]|uniref:HAMP domain-containing sensor histidine kinase n=1 Tax=Actinotalea caeni TaxID=1348467 RepID=UPI002B4AB71F|nr:HAMP domain-containing sensor histidine kinase [Actinotalea caeni]HLV55644.1 HAMP domain-containing sensor histidine kinase [Actinotalea caeni]
MTAPRRRTLRRRLTLLTAGALAVALAAGGVLLVQVVTAQRVDALDEAVVSRAVTVADLVRTDRLPDSLPVVAPGEVVQILDPAGRVVATSGTASQTLPVVTPEVAARGEAADGTRPLVVTAASPYAGQARVAMLTVPAAEVPARLADVAGDRGLLVVAATSLGDVHATARTLGWLLAGVVPVLVLGLGLAVWLVLGRALRPVEDLRAAAEEVADSGGPGSLPVPATGELAALATTLNTMLDRLDAAASAERAAASSARAAAQRQQAFVADAAHELRSPLASLRTALEVAERHPEVYPRTELVADLGADVARISALVEDLLLLARVGSRPLRAEPLDLAAVAARVAAETAEAPARAVAVEVVGEGGATGDAAAVERVLRNLVANARRHARTRVRVTVAPGEVAVDDDGHGVPEAERERVFARFVRLEEARERDAGGSGLGLAIARELAREQGGDVTLHDSSLGGLSARLELPVP